MANATQDVAVMNTLIATLLDSVDGYEQSMDNVSNQMLAERFADRANERREVVTELQAAVTAAGGDPEDDGTVLGGAHRVFLNLKQKVMDSDDKGILSEVERGEDYLKGKFAAALADAELSPVAREVVENAWESVRDGHDEMRALRNAMTDYPTD